MQTYDLICSEVPDRQLQLDISVRLRQDVK